jgi:hypothetical protein
MRLQIFGQVMRGIVLACSMTDHDNFAAQGYGVRDLLVIRPWLQNRQRDRKPEAA